MATKQRIMYAPLVWALKGVARLPLWILYGLSDFLYLLCYHVAGYRKGTVRKNLKESFPDKTDAELKRIERSFYRQLSDYAVETVKLFHISDDEMRRRMKFEGVEHVDRLLKQGKSITAYFSHTGNWEWVPSITLWSKLTPHVDCEFCQVYRPLKNKVFDKMFLTLRSRFKSVSFAKQTVFRDLLCLRRDKMPSITGFMSDQKPSHGDPTYVVKFLNHPTAMITGTETLSRRLDMAAVYFDLEKERRGHYKVVVRPMSDNVSELQPMELTAKYVELLETTIRRNPAIWLWSHKRWKHPVEMRCHVNQRIVMTETVNAFSRQRPSDADVAVVILNWNGRKLLEEFLPSVVATTGSIGCVTVADNGSTDDSLEWLDDNYPSLYKIMFAKNYGFAEGYNRVLRIAAEAGFKYVVLLNSDVSTSEGWLETLYDYMESHPDVAACQPKLLSYRDRGLFEYAGASGGFIDRNGYPYCRGRIFDTCEQDKGQYDDVVNVDWASGAALMVRTDVYLEAGGLDASFFAHMEEIDLCWRMRLLGYNIAVVPSAVVYHLGGGSLPPSDPRKTYLNFRNNLLMLHKNLHPDGRTRKLIWRRILDTAAWVKYVLSGNWKSAKAVVNAHLDYARMSKDIKQRADGRKCADDTLLRPNILVEYYMKRHKRYSELRGRH